MGETRLRIPKLSYTPKCGLGYHVNYRDPATGVAKKHKFGMVSETEALALYHRWLTFRLDSALVSRRLLSVILSSQTNAIVCLLA